MNISNISNAVVTTNTSNVGSVTKERPVESNVIKKQANEQNFIMNKEKQKQQVQKTVQKLNDFFDPIATNLKFVFHEDLHEYYVTVVNPITDEVIREIPPKKLLDMYAAMTEFIGVLVDEKI